jgi:hypothetical protein
MVLPLQERNFLLGRLEVVQRELTADAAIKERKKALIRKSLN